MLVVKILGKMERRGEGAIPVWGCPNIACLGGGFEINARRVGYCFYDSWDI